MVNVYIVKAVAKNEPLHNVEMARVESSREVM